MSRLRLPIAAAALLGAVTSLVVAGVAQSRPAARALTHVNYATSFGNFGRDAYVYVAIEKGYFAQAGLDVSVSPGNGSVDNMKLLAAGRLDYAPIDITAAVQTRANEGVPVKIVSVVHQKTLSAIFTLKDSGISTPKQLEGKKVGDIPGSTTQVVFPLYAKRAGVDASTVTFIPANPATEPALLAAGKFDAVGQFAVGVPLFEKVSGKKISVFPYSRYFPGLMGIGIAVSDAKLASDPAQVRKFVAALNRGLKYALGNPGEAGRILQKYVPLADPEVAAGELRIMRDYVLTDQTRRCGIGYGDPKRFGATISVVNNGFHPRTGLRVRDVYASGFVATTCK